MTKALITNINSVWGVIVNPQSSNTYRHVLSFDNDKLRDDFISQELFNGNDYKTELDKQPKISLTSEDAVTASFRVNVSDYPGESLYSLLNKDFAIIKEENQIRFYTLQGKRLTAESVEYRAELDIFFTHDIKNMFNDKPARIKQAMLDRYKVNSDNKLIPIYAEDKEKTSPIYFSEEFDKDYSDILIPFDEPQPLIQDLTRFMTEYVEYNSSNIEESRRPLTEAEKKRNE